MTEAIEAQWLQNAANLWALIISIANVVALVRVVVTRSDFELYKAHLERQLAEAKETTVREQLRNEKDHRDMRHEMKNELQAQINLVQLQLARIEGNVTWLMRRQSSEHGE
jgi:hypothetical protein